MNFSKLLINWYLQNKRNLPWRETTNPYSIWLSEIILQQTRVAQGLPYYVRFIEEFPTVFDLANASEFEVLKLWQGLGYYSRARNLHATAKHIAFELNGVFPNNYKELQTLKGVGEYTAAAIASFAYGEIVPVVDGNVFRVLSRIYGVYDDISINSSKKIFQELASKLISKTEPAFFNQAIMEFGAIQCVPKNPDCETCIFKTSCYAFKNNLVATFPVKTKKIKVAKKYFNYLIFRDAHENFLLFKRTGKGIWENLHEFYLLEKEKSINTAEMLIKLKSFQFENSFPKSIVLKNDKVILHKLSHQHLHIYFYELHFNSVFEGGLLLEQIKKYPFPVVIHNFIESNYN